MNTHNNMYEEIDDDLNDDDAIDDDASSVFDEEPPKSPPSEFALQLRPRLENILQVLTQAEMIEFDDKNREPLIEEMTEAAENARNPKAILKALMYALIESEYVEEVYGSDPELLNHIQNAIAIK
ncbi:MAG: hypothetical protein JXX29_00700 [Deltaproteobacteria bacterium]|nr:hypothetical protein [Deltaproteobacteria bacterium]MBN2670156.1 hypothetical protein [Deltaproteobacteria bacterium]